MADCEFLGVRFHNNGWADWVSYGNLTVPGSGQTYIASTKIKNVNLNLEDQKNGQLITVLKIKTPEVESTHAAKLTVKIPFVRASDYSDTSGTIYYKIFETDPTGSDPTDSDSVLWFDENSSSVIKQEWSFADQQIHTISFDATSIKAASEKTYYLAVRASTILIILNKAYNGNTLYKPILDYTYTTYTNGSTPTIQVYHDGYGNVTISGTQGISGTNNEITTTEIYYTTDGSDPSKSTSNRTKIAAAASSGSGFSQDIPPLTARTRIRAYIKCTFTYGPATTASADVSIPHYVAPNVPGKPALTADSFKNGRLTNNQTWTYTWAATTGRNDDSPVAGYRVYLGRNSVPQLMTYNTDNGFLNPGGEQNYVDVAPDVLSVKINPKAFGYIPKDSVKLSVYAFSINKHTGAILSSGIDIGDYMNAQGSDITTVQNAGIVQVKANNSWHEGQVWVKVNGNWTEADSVYTKVNGSWVESQ